LSIPVHGDIGRKYSFYLKAIGHSPKANLPEAAVEFRKRDREAVVKLSDILLIHDVIIYFIADEQLQ